MKQTLVQEVHIWLLLQVSFDWNIKISETLASLIWCHDSHIDAYYNFNAVHSVFLPYENAKEVWFNIFHTMLPTLQDKDIVVFFNVALPSGILSLILTAFLVLSWDFKLFTSKWWEIKVLVYIALYDYTMCSVFSTKIDQQDTFIDDKTA